MDMEIPLTYTSNAYGREWSQYAQMLVSMLREGGLNVTPNGVDYSTVFIPHYLRAKGDFVGLGLWTNGPRADVGQWLTTFFSSVGANNQVGDAYPDLDAKIFKQQTIADFQERVSAVHEIQQYMAENAIAIPSVGRYGTSGTDLSWEELQGRDLLVWPGGNPGDESIPHYWFKS